MKRLIRKSNIESDKFSELQLDIINQAEQRGFNVDIFNDPNIPHYTMNSIFDSLQIIQSKYYDPNTILNEIRNYAENINEIEEKLRVFAKIITMGKYFDESRRNEALLYVNGNFYTGQTHNDCIIQFTNQKKRKKPSFKWVRPDEEESGEIFKSSDVVFMGHVVSDVNSVEINPYVNDEKAIYLVNEDIWLKNTNIEDAAKRIKQSEYFSGYSVYVDDNWSVNFETMLREYPKL